jgi:hypothetical protein
VKTRKRRDSIMKLKLAERDATLYYEQIDYSAYQDVARSKKDRTPVNLTGGKPGSGKNGNTTLEP